MAFKIAPGDSGMALLLVFFGNRQYIVNLQAIRGIAETIREGYEITMSDHRKLEISRRQALELKELLSF